MNNTITKPTAASVLDAVSAYKYIISFLVIGFVIALFNVAWSVRHSLRIRKWNMFNAGLVTCTSFFVLNIISIVIFPTVKYYYSVNGIKPSADFKKSLAIGLTLFNRLTWTGTTLIYLMLVQSR